MRESVASRWYQFFELTYHELEQKGVNSPGPRGVRVSAASGKMIVMEGGYGACAETVMSVWHRT